MRLRRTAAPLSTARRHFHKEPAAAPKYRTSDDLWGLNRRGVQSRIGTLWRKLKDRRVGQMRITSIKALTLVAALGSALMTPALGCQSPSCAADQPSDNTILAMGTIRSSSSGPTAEESSGAVPARKCEPRAGPETARAGSFVPLVRSDSSTKCPPSRTSMRLVPVIHKLTGFHSPLAR